eukprot:GHVU01208947.1.p1 GENE.GHVU01208947.1~~GHVU01208947.1.p1  ORF type:complete len:622 (+),score=78.42 GHVU01208947.1:488-2353(+)
MSKTISDVICPKTSPRGIPSAYRAYYPGDIYKHIPTLFSRWVETLFNPEYSIYAFNEVWKTLLMERFSLFDAHFLALEAGYYRKLTPQAYYARVDKTVSLISTWLMHSLVESRVPSVLRMLCRCNALAYFEARIEFTVRATGGRLEVMHQYTSVGQTVAYCLRAISILWPFFLELPQYRHQEVVLKLLSTPMIYYLFNRSLPIALRGGKSTSSHICKVAVSTIKFISELLFSVNSKYVIHRITLGIPVISSAFHRSSLEQVNMGIPRVTTASKKPRGVTAPKTRTEAEVNVQENFYLSLWASLALSFDGIRSIPESELGLFEEHDPEYETIEAVGARTNFLVAREVLQFAADLFYLCAVHSMAVEARYLTRIREGCDRLQRIARTNVPSLANQATFEDVRRRALRMRDIIDVALGTMPPSALEGELGGRGLQSAGKLPTRANSGGAAKPPPPKRVGVPAAGALTESEKIPADALYELTTPGNKTNAGTISKRLSTWPSLFEFQNVEGYLRVCWHAKCNSVVPKSGELAGLDVPVPPTVAAYCKRCRIAFYCSSWCHDADAKAHSKICSTFAHPPTFLRFHILPKMFGTLPPTEDERYFNVFTPLIFPEDVISLFENTTVLV